MFLLHIHRFADSSLLTSLAAEPLPLSGLTSTSGSVTVGVVWASLVVSPPGVFGFELAFLLLETS